MTVVSVPQGQISCLDNILLKPVPLLSGQLDTCRQLILLFDGVFLLGGILLLEGSLEMAGIACLFDDALHFKVLLGTIEGFTGLILPSHS